VQRNDFEGGRRFCQFCEKRFAFMVEFRRTETDHIWIADTLGLMTLSQKPAPPLAFLSEHTLANILQSTIVVTFADAPDK
jgi:hypothetical protein